MLGLINFEVFSLFLFKMLYVGSLSKLKRLDGTSKSPIFEHFSETLNGLSSIKAFKVEDRFIDLLQTKVDGNSKFIYSNNLTDRYYFKI